MLVSPVSPGKQAADGHYILNTVSVKPSGLHFCCSCYLDMLRFLEHDCNSPKNRKTKSQYYSIPSQDEDFKEKLCSNDSL